MCLFYLYATARSEIKFVQINMKQVSYSRPYLGSVNLTKHDLKEFYGNMR